jgi:hypothetical protein
MNQHLSQDELVMVYYGETESPDHLRECGACRKDYERLAVLLENVRLIPAPEPGPAFAGKVWRAIEPQLGNLDFDKRPFTRAPIQIRRPMWKRIAVPAAIAAMLVIAFQLGRYMPAERVQQVDIATSPDSAGTVLDGELGRHLERSRRMLVELVNSPDSPNWNIAAERATAEDLLENNRLYRQTASQVGQISIEETLEDLERILLEISHSPDTVPAETIDSLRRRIESLELLFRVRVLESQIRGRREAANLPESNL